MPYLKLNHSNNLKEISVKALVSLFGSKSHEHIELPCDLQYLLS